MVALSEYVAASIGTQEAVWLRALLADLKFIQDAPTVIEEDNKGAIALSKYPKFHGRTKHVDIRYHFIRDKVESEEILLKYCPTNNMVANVLTKALSKNSFERFRTMLCMSNNRL